MSSSEHSERSTRRAWRPLFASFHGRSRHMIGRTLEVWILPSVYWFGMVSICHEISCCSMLLCPGISQKFFCCCRRVVGATVAFLAVAVLAAVPLSLNPTSLVVIISLSSCNPLFWCSLSPMLSKAALPNLFIVVFRNQAEGGPKHARSINEQSNPAHGAQNKGFV